jgi:hypothetical protein
MMFGVVSQHLKGAGNSLAREVPNTDFKNQQTPRKTVINHPLFSSDENSAPIRTWRIRHDATCTWEETVGSEKIEAVVPPSASPVFDTA